MKLLSLLFILVCSLGYSQESTPAKFKKKAAEYIFLKEVESAIRTHDADKLLSLMKPDYKKSQHDEFLEGRTVQFLNEFLGGEIPFNEIDLARLINYKLLDGSKNEFEVLFYLEGNGKKVNCSFYLHKDLNTKVLSLYGAVG